jgi:PTS system nitrogen regulatory IIA component
MKVLDILDSTSICLDLKSTQKEDVLAELCTVLESQGKIKDKQAVLTALMDRERLGSTGIGQGVAIPHGKSDSALELVAALGVSKKGVQFGALDGEPVFVIFLLISPPDSAGNHLKALARVSRLLKDKFFRQAIKEAKVADDVKKVISEEDEY